MNLFILHRNPTIAASLHTNKHVCKMILECAQIACSAHPEGEAPYKRTHYNHPVCKWARSDVGHYWWTVKLGLELCKEYTKRYGKVHKTQAVLEWLDCHTPKDLPMGGGSRMGFVQCMPDKYKCDSPVTAYTYYYSAEKLSMSPTSRKDIIEDRLHYIDFYRSIYKALKRLHCKEVEVKSDNNGNVRITCTYNGKKFDILKPKTEANLLESVLKEVQSD